VTIPVKAGRSLTLEKEVIRDRINRDDETFEVVEDWTFLLSNRFIVKCHREGGGYACYLCYRRRGIDTLCRGMESLVNHVMDKHDIAEYESDPDIRETIPYH
jgi:hypothetical protein